MTDDAETTGDVDAYVSAASEGRRAALARLRDLCLEELVGFEEVLAHRMPAYRRDGVVEVAFAEQKQYVSCYLLRSDVMEEFAERLAAWDTGKGVLRFRRADDIDFDLLRDLLRATAATRGPIC